MVVLSRRFLRIRVVSVYLAALPALESEAFIIVIILKEAHLVLLAISNRFLLEMLLAQETSAIADSASGNPRRNRSSIVVAEIIPDHGLLSVPLIKWILV